MIFGVPFSLKQHKQSSEPIGLQNLLDASEANCEKDILASLSELERGVDLSTINFSNDLMFAVANLYVPGTVNSNFLYISPEDGVKYYKSFKDKFIDLEHNRNYVVGFIYNVFLSEFGTNTVLTEEEALERKIFNVSIGFYLWKKIMKPKLVALLENMPKEDMVSLSFEYASEGFNYFRFKQEKESEWEPVSHEQMEKEFGSAFKDGDSKNKQQISFLGPQKNGFTYIRQAAGVQQGIGAGLVLNPAAKVKGIRLIEEESEELRANKKPQNTANFGSSNNFCKKEQDKSKISVKSVEATFNMKLFKDLTDFASNWDSLKESSAHDIIASVREFLAEEIKKKDAEFSESLAQEKNRLKEIETEKEKLSAEIQDLRARLNAIQEAQAKQEAIDRYNNFMSDIDATFDLSEDERAIVAEDIKQLHSEEQFAVYKHRLEKLLKEKTKAYKAEKAAKIKEMAASKGLSIKENSVDLEDIFASIVPPKAPILNGVEKSEDLKTQMDEVFSKAITVNFKK